MAHLDLGIDGLEPTPAQLSCTGLSDDIAVAPPATEEDIEAIIDSIGRMEMEERETAAAPRGVRMDTSKKMGGALGAKRGSTKRGGGRRQIGTTRARRAEHPFTKRGDHRHRRQGRQAPAQARRRDAARRRVGHGGRLAQADARRRLLPSIARRDDAGGFTSS